MKERPILFSGPMVKALLDGSKTQTRRLCKQAVDQLRGRGPSMGEPADAVYPDGSGKGWIAWWGRGPFSAEETARLYPGNAGFKCPHGAPGDRLWVRETWGPGGMIKPGDPASYAADWPDAETIRKWKPSIHMPRALSRIDLETVEVRVQRLQDITEEDARAEGVTIEHGTFQGVKWLARSPEDIHVHAFARLWDTINGERAAWASNPWVWALTVKRVRP